MSVEPSANPIDLAQEETFVLGEIEVRPPTRELVVAGRSEKLEPRVMQVLVTLARRRGKVVSRDELIARCWGGRIVSEDAINRCISAVRRVAETHGGFQVNTVTRVGYRLDTDGQIEEAAELRAEPLLAVLAFDNLSGDPEMAYFSDGVSEEILDTVARSADLRVIARSSSFQFRGPDKAVRRVREELKVTHLLDGSVRRSGSRVRVVAQLVDCDSETTIWSDRFDREMTDVLLLQDEIAAAVAESLKAALATGEAASPIDPSVYELYLRAKEGLATWPVEDGLDIVIGRFQEVTTKAAGFADGWAMLALSLAAAARQGDPGEPFRRRRADALAAADEAIRLNPGNATAYVARLVLEPEGAYWARQAIVRKCLKVAPNHPDTLTAVAELAIQTGRMREAAEAARKASELDPLESSSARLFADATFAFDEEETRRLYLAGRAKWPASPGWSRALMGLLAYKNDWPAFADAEAFAWKQGHFASASVRAVRALGIAVRADDPAYSGRLRQMLEDELARTGSAPLDLVIPFALVASIDEAFAFIERASYDHIFENGGGTPARAYGGGVLFLAWARSLLATDPRYVRLCNKLGLVDFWLKTGLWPDIADEVPYDFRAEARRVAAQG
ncbi:MAG TPA: winged helix-turn-helix domain-containing protein [Caulobacteraceae bacterium]|jgi:TolB-like protein/tetratricopeptide (TPR) repeat protein